MLLSKKIKLEVSEADAAALEFMQGKCRGLYNWWVMLLRDGEHWPGVYEAKKSLQASKRHDPELEFVYGKLLHEVYYRLDNAMKAFWRRLEAGEAPGFPRVRPRHNFFTLCYPACYLKIIGDKLILPTGGGGRHGPKRFSNIAAKLTEVPPAGFREVAISRDARGNYSASFPIGKKRKPNSLDRWLPSILASRRWQRALTSRDGHTTLTVSRDHAGTISSWTRYVPSEASARRSLVGISA
jgi:putative transposase